MCPAREIVIQSRRHQPDWTERPDWTKLLQDYDIFNPDVIPDSDLPEHTCAMPSWSLRELANIYDLKEEHSPFTSFQHLRIQFLARVLLKPVELGNALIPPKLLSRVDKLLANMCDIVQPITTGKILEELRSIQLDANSLPSPNISPRFPMVDCRKVAGIKKDIMNNLTRNPSLGDGHRRKGIGPIPLNAITVRSEFDREDWRSTRVIITWFGDKEFFRAVHTLAMFQN